MLVAHPVRGRLMRFKGAEGICPRRIPLEEVKLQFDAPEEKQGDFGVGSHLAITESRRNGIRCRDQPTSKKVGAW